MYYCAEFHHPWVAEDADEDTVGRVCHATEKVIHDTLTQMGIEWKHAYTWPGDCIYKYIRSDVPCQELQDAIGRAIPTIGCILTKVDPGEDPGKWHYKSVDDYFNGVVCDRT